MRKKKKKSVEKKVEIVEAKKEMSKDFPGSPECYLAEKKQFEGSR